MAYDASKLAVYATGETSFVVKNISTDAVTRIKVAIDIKRASGGACVYWNWLSLRAGESKQVDIIVDMGENPGTTIKAVRLDSCE
jgi:hypothetical protein